jgi:hypothetical protein
MSALRTPILQLSRLKGKIQGLSKDRGAAHAEACRVCFEHKGHTSGVQMQVSGSSAATYKIAWNEIVGDVSRSSWADTQEATESAACGIAILLALKSTNYTYVERSVKTTGIDYWLGAKPASFDARLEISGILNENEKNSPETRLKQKLRQTEASSQTGLPAFVVIVEFSNPRSIFQEK